MMNAMAVERELAPAPFATDEARWSAVVRRDRGADGTFYYAVSTTGVYLPAVLCVQARQTRPRVFPRDLRRRRGRGLSALQALPTKWPRPRGTARGRCGRGLQVDRNGGSGPRTRAVGASGRLEPLSFPSGVHRSDGIDAEGVRLCASRPSAPPRAPPRRSRDRRHLRRGLRLQQPLLRINGRLPRHVSRGVPERRAWNDHPLRGRGVFAGIGTGRGNRQGCVRDSARR